MPHDKGDKFGSSTSPADARLAVPQRSAARVQQRACSFSVRMSIHRPGGSAGMMSHGHVARRKHVYLHHAAACSDMQRHACMHACYAAGLPSPAAAPTQPKTQDAHGPWHASRPMSIVAQACARLAGWLEEGGGGGRTTPWAAWSAAPRWCPASRTRASPPLAPPAPHAQAASIRAMAIRPPTRSKQA